MSFQSNVFESYQEQFFCINSFCSLPETGGLKIDFEIEISILSFRRRPQQVSLSLLHCDTFETSWSLSVAL